MDINEIQALIKFVAKSGVTEVELETKGFKIVIKTKPEQVMMASPVQMMQQAPQQLASHQAPAPQAAPAAVATPVSDESKYIAIKSPMIGTFYRSSGPDKPSFISVGDEIQPGKVICIIEAMKLFNEIESDIAGRIVKVLVDDGKPVEYDQVLFLVEPA
ncbi:MAG: acetyl-CoA carboxylase biotin carboxyl carrier protein [Bacteroidetes bacterium]|nr:acetyl-CoA carboxylase biotin carboxyl carrier protein [Bacteroidota bacterium]HET6244423.1 acetyl-CoA carboxylase biotin carboxyl carrier protein [Bacteroidia bacterium]